MVAVRPHEQPGIGNLVLFQPLLRSQPAYLRPGGYDDDLVLPSQLAHLAQNIRHRKIVALRLEEPLPTLLPWTLDKMKPMAYVGQRSIKVDDDDGLGHEESLLWAGRPYSFESEKAKMKSMLLGLLLACLAITPATVLAQDKLDCANATTQLEMNQCAAKDFDAADKELNQTYQAILAKYKDDATFIANLRKAQRAWMAFRDAELDAKFPLAAGQSARIQYGSMYPMCYLGAKAELTRQRTAQLKDLLKNGPGC